MALTSVFYDAPVTETDWATSRAGAPDYGVYGPDDFKVSTHPSMPYALVVKAGKAHGWGVTDTAAADETVQAATLSTGTRYDLVVVRRNWQPAAGGPTTLEIIQGGSTVPSINTLRTIGPGVEDDQPIALVKWTGGVNTPSSIIDLRCWAGNGGMVAADTMALSYLATPGADVMISGITWRYSADSNGVWGWAATVSAMTAYTPVLTAEGTNPSLGTGVATGQYQVIGKLMLVQFFVPFSTTGNIGSGNYLVSLPPGFTYGGAGSAVPLGVFQAHLNATPTNISGYVRQNTSGGSKVYMYWQSTTTTVATVGSGTVSWTAQAGTYMSGQLMVPLA